MGGARVGAGGAEGGGIDILYFNIFINAMEIERGERDTKHKHY